jgi:hypothetical protein
MDVSNECGQSGLWQASEFLSCFVSSVFAAIDHGLLKISFSRVEDSSTRYVAEENIMLQNPDEPNQELMRLAGRFFKRWDCSTREFVSNIKGEYPDD